MPGGRPAVPVRSPPCARRSASGLWTRRRPGSWSKRAPSRDRGPARSGCAWCGAAWCGPVRRGPVRCGWCCAGERAAGLAHRSGGPGRGDADTAAAAGPGARRPGLGGPAPVRGDGGRSGPAHRAARGAPAPSRGPAGLPRGRDRARRSRAGGGRSPRGRRGGGGGPAGVEVLAVLPELYIPHSGFRVTPVLGWWRAPSPLVAAADGEIVSAARARLADLADPANRLSVRHPSGAAGPAFRVHGMLVWGFTAALVDRLVALGGWERPWDSGRKEDLPPDVIDAAARS